MSQEPTHRRWSILRAKYSDSWYQVNPQEPPQRAPPAFRRFTWGASKAGTTRRARLSVRGDFSLTAKNKGMCPRMKGRRRYNHPRHPTRDAMEATTHATMTPRPDPGADLGTEGLSLARSVGSCFHWTQMERLRCVILCTSVYQFDRHDASCPRD